MPQGIVRSARRPPGWVAPGPRPAAPSPEARPELWPGAGEDLCFLTGDWRLLQRVDGHRWSVDDLVCAWTAAGAVATPPALTVDLGCGIGSVLLMIAWRFPDARAVGIEAQPVSIALARRSIAFNGAEHRVEVRHGDLRDRTMTADLSSPAGLLATAGLLGTTGLPGTAGLRGTAGLVTGTPPYFPRGQGLESTLPQRGPCRFEHRGGIEDYCLAAAPLLAPGAPFVAVEGAGQRRRVEAAAIAADLRIERWREIVPRAGKAPLFSVAVLRHPSPSPAPTLDEPDLIVRDRAGRWTDEFRAVREAMGMPSPG